jgi:hypothetical protein
VHCASGVNSLTTGVKSMSGCWLSMRAICAWQLAMSCYSDPSLVLALRASLKSVQNGSCRFSRFVFG